MPISFITFISADSFYFFYFEFGGSHDCRDPIRSDDDGFFGGFGLVKLDLVAGAFEEQVLMEPFPETDTDSASVNQPEARPILPANPVASPGSTPEAPAAAPSPDEGALPAPHPDELERLRNEIHSLIESQVRKECDRRFGPVSLLPEQREANSFTARHIMDQLEIPTETDPTNLQE